MTAAPLALPRVAMQTLHARPCLQEKHWEGVPGADKQGQVAGCAWLPGCCLSADRITCGPSRDEAKGPVLRVDAKEGWM